MQKGLVALILTLAINSPLASTPAQAGQDCAAKVLASCTSCHYPTRICEKLGEKSRREWKVTIKRMLRYGLVLDEAGQDSMLECLVALEPEKGKLCK